MSNKSIKGKSFLNNIVLGRKTKIFLRVLLWMEILVIGLYLLNIIFSYFITGSFEIQNPFIFHYDVWIILLDTSTFNAMLRLSMPIALTAMGASFNERVGNINIGLEGIMLWGAWAAVYFSYTTGNAWAGVIAAMFFGILIALIHAVLTITLKAEQIVTGVAINLLALGLTNVLTLVIWETQYSPIVETIPKFNFFTIPILGDIIQFLSFSQYSNIPIIGVIFDTLPDPIKILNNHNIMIYIGLLLIPLLHILLFKTNIGLRFRVIGEHPQTAATAGINVIKYQYAAVLISGALAGLGGSILSIGLASQFIQNASAGKGFIALAAMIFGKWTIFGSVLGSVIFGYFFSLQIKFDILLRNFYVPNPFIQMIPYLVTILALTGFIGKARPPKHIGKPYDPTED